MGTLIIFAAISIFLLMWLKSLLGQEDEDQSNMQSPATDTDASYSAPKKVFPEQEVPEHALRGEPCSVKDGLKAIAYKMPDFDESQFLNNAKMAFGMILKAFDEGDLGTLKQLLCPDVYESFKKVINDRTIANQTAQTDIISLEDVDIVNARISGHHAEITVRFASKQKFCLKDSSGEIIEGSEDDIDEIVDAWTFKRDFNTSNPVWELVHTADA